MPPEAARVRLGGAIQKHVLGVDQVPGRHLNQRAAHHWPRQGPHGGDFGHVVVRELELGGGDAFRFHPFERKREGGFPRPLVPRRRDAHHRLLLVEQAGPGVVVNRRDVLAPELAVVAEAPGEVQPPDSDARAPGDGAGGGGHAQQDRELVLGVVVREHLVVRGPVMNAVGGVVGEDDDGKIHDAVLGGEGGLEGRAAAAHGAVLFAVPCRYD